jgi:hypothetical protein
MSSSSQNLYSHEPYNHRFKTQQIPMLIQTELVKENREQKKEEKTQTLARPAGLAPTVWFTGPKTPVFGFDKYSDVDSN